MTLSKKNHSVISFGSYIWTEMRVSVCHYLIYIRRIRVHGSKSIHMRCLCIHKSTSSLEYEIPNKGKWQREKKKRQQQQKFKQQKTFFFVVHTKTVFMHDISRTSSECETAAAAAATELWWTGNHIYINNSAHINVGSLCCARICVKHTCRCIRFGIRMVLCVLFFCSLGRSFVRTLLLLLLLLLLV